MALTVQTPNVYINEDNAFPNSVAAVATAIPVFIGYTRRADHEGRSYYHQTVEIHSLNDFLTFFGAMSTGPIPGPAPDLEQYAPIYHVVSSRGNGDLSVGGRPMDLLPDPGTVYHLYNSIRLFYENGGGTAFVVSVGPMSAGTGKPMTAGEPLINPNVQYADLYRGLGIGGQEPRITMIVIPDAVLLKEADYSTLLRNVLQQCDDSQSRVGIIDVYGGDDPDPERCLTTEIANFRTNVGMDHLNYGIAYFPFLRTTIVQDADINFLNLGGSGELASVLPDANVDPLRTILAQIQDPPPVNPPTAARLENALMAASDDYSQIHDHVLAKINTLPPSGAMAGVYTAVDNSLGVWCAPANVSLTAVTDVTLQITDQSQGSLNVDPVTGKSINAIRRFPGFGVTVWGARTLDGNSQDWRYVNVRRTVIMIEQSVKLALRAYVFAPNVSNTWSLIQSMITSFLTGVWSQGGLVGSTAAAAFEVAVGLGSTMTPDDILNGILRMTARVAVTHPAEFIVITISQQQQS